jgi:hypothetical protein
LTQESPFRYVIGAGTGINCALFLCYEHAAAAPAVAASTLLLLLLLLLQYAAFEDNDKVYLLQEYAEGVSQQEPA